MDQGLLGGAGQWDKGQQAGTEAQEVPPEHQDKVPYCAGDTALEQVTQVGCGFPPSMGIFKNYLDTLLCHVLQDKTA